MFLQLLLRTLLPFGLPIVLVLAVFLLARKRVPFLMTLPPWLWISLIGLLVVIWALVVFWSWLAARRRAKAIEKGLMQQAQWGVENASPSRRAEMEEIRKNLSEALAMLKNGPQGKRSLYQLPWYLIIGPPAIGKTTLIVNSGLNFPGLTTARRMRGSGGTRNCDWWFSTDAILLDTAGRYAQSADRSETETEWFGFLDLLRKHRKKGPINGLILGYSIESLGQSDETRIVSDARELRQRLDEIMDRLKWTFPVYVLFTKCDLVSGFAEYWSSLSPAERQQVWGTAYPAASAGSADGERFRNGFQALVRRLKEHRIRRMGQLEQGDAWGRAFMFPEEFAALESRLHLFVETLFEANPFRKDAPLFRGAYFSSGRQMGRPFDILIGQIQNMLGGRAPEAEVQPEKEDAFFVRDLFAKVLKGDRDLVGGTHGARRQWARLQFLGSTGLFLLSVLSCLWIATSCTRLGGRMNATKSAVTALPAGGADDATLVRRLEEIRQSARRGWRAFPLVVANSVRDSALSVYGRVSRDRILEPIEADIARALDAPSDLDADQVRRALRAELMLVDPVNGREYGQAVDLAGALADFGFQGKETDPAVQAALKGLAEEFLERKEPIRPLAARRDELSSGGRRLADTHRPREMLDGLVAAAGREAEDITLTTLGADDGLLSAPASARVRAAFTREGWEKKVSKDLKEVARLLEDDRKLLQKLGVQGDGGTVTAEQIFEVYADEYPREWSDFVASVSLKSYADCGQLAPVLKELSQPKGSALLQLLERAGARARLEAGLIEGAVGGGRVSALNAEMEPLLGFGTGGKDQPSPADEYADLLAALRRDVAACADDPAAATSRVALQDAQDWVDRFSDRFRGNGVATSMGDLLGAPLSAASGVLRASGGQAAEQAFGAQVAGPVGQRLGSRYPFGSGEDDQASFEDVSKFLGPGGTIETFADGLLQGRQALSSEMSGFLSRLTDIRKGLSMGDALESRFTLELRELRAQEGNDTGLANLRRVDQVLVSIGDHREAFQAPGDRAEFTWSSGAATMACGVELRHTAKNQVVDQIQLDSDWAICQLFDRGRATRSGGATRVVWPLRDSGMEVEFLVTMRGGAECPFARGSAFRRLPGNLPADILAGP
jgi:type VI secretion system IcmF/VasK family protein